jgi:putative PIN family toxin of toxin-antitoxin system
MKVLLDTNVWLSGLLWGGNPRKIIQLAEQEKVTLYSSLLLFQELEETLSYPKIQRRLTMLGMTANELLSKVRLITKFYHPQPLSLIPQLRDPKDKIILETALAIPVDTIISGDLDLLILGQFEQIPILTASDFLQRIEGDTIKKID